MQSKPEDIKAGDVSCPTSYKFESSCLNLRFLPKSLCLLIIGPRMESQKSCLNSYAQGKQPQKGTIKAHELSRDKF